MINLGFLGYPSYSIDEEGNVYSKNKNDYLKPQKNTQGYLQVSLSEGGCSKTLTIHRLVGLTYNGDTFVQGHHCHHRDGDIYNNNKDNLCWLSPSDHIAEGWRMGQLTCKYTTHTLGRINDCLKKGFSDRKISETLDVPLYLVQEFRTGKLKTASSETVIDRYERRDKERVAPPLVREVIDYLNKGLQDSDIAEILNIPRKKVNRIRKGETFKEYQEGLVATPLSSEKFNKRLNKEDVRNIILLQEKGEGISSIARTLGITRDKVKSVYHKKCYKNIIDEIADELACQASASLKEIEESQIEC